MHEKVENLWYFYISIQKQNIAQKKEAILDKKKKFQANEKEEYEIKTISHIQVYI